MVLATVSLAAVAAVLCGNDVAMVTIDPPEVVRHVPLPARGLTLFAAPDGRILVPLAADAATAVVDASGSVRTWQGRLFPLFFDQPDRMLVVVPGELVTLSYPERLPLDRAPLTDVDGAWRAACSADGRLVAIVPVGRERQRLVLSGTRGEGPTWTVDLAAPADSVVVAPDAGWAVVGHDDGSLELTVPGGASWRGATGMVGRVVALAVDARGRELTAAVEDGEGGAVVGLRVTPGKRQPLRPRFVTRLPAAPSALARVDDDVLVLAGDALFRLTKRGRRIEGRVAVPGATAVVVLPEHPVSAIPAWSD